MSVTKKETQRVRALVKKLGLVGASKLLGLHHSTVARIIGEQSVQRKTAALARQRLASLESEAA
jgi:hypothetical protein